MRSGRLTQAWTRRSMMWLGGSSPVQSRRQTRLFARGWEHHYLIASSQYMISVLFHLIVCCSRARFLSLASPQARCLRHGRQTRSRLSSMSTAPSITSTPFASPSPTVHTYKHAELAQLVEYTKLWVSGHGTSFPKHLLRCGPSIC